MTWGRRKLAEEAAAGSSAMSFNGWLDGDDGSVLRRLGPAAQPLIPRKINLFFDLWCICFMGQEQLVHMLQNTPTDWSRNRIRRIIVRMTKHKPIVRASSFVRTVAKRQTQWAAMEIFPPRSSNWLRVSKPRIRPGRARSGWRTLRQAVCETLLSSICLKQHVARLFNNTCKNI